MHEISIIAFEAAADPDRFPELGEPWQVLKLYYSTWSRARIVATHEKMLELGLESPYDEKWFEGPSQDHRITTQIEVSAFYLRRKEALLAHATQIDPDGGFWFALPDEIAATVYPWEDFELARSLVGGELAEGEREDDLFAGVRERVADGAA